MKTLPIVAVILLCQQALNAMPNGGKDETTIATKSSASSSSHSEEGQGSTTKVYSSSDSSAGKQTKSTKTVTKSSSSSSSHSGGEDVGGKSRSHTFFETSDGDDCGCDGAGHSEYEITEEDLKYLESTDIFTESELIELHSHGCENQVKKLNEDNDHLTAQLQSANSIISKLTEEKSWVLGELEECRDEYNCVSEDFVKITTELKIVKKKLLVAIDESGKLRTQLIAANADAQKWKTKSDNFEIDLRKTKEINIQLTITVNEYTTTITNLCTTINEITIKNNKCGAESDEWKRKWEAEHAKGIKNDKTIKDLEASNAELKSRIAKLTDDLSCCQNGNQQNDIEINELKNTVSDLKKQLSCCIVDLGNCNVTLKRVTEEFNADEINDHEEAIIRDKLALELRECNARRKDLEKNYESEKNLVINCKNEIISIREECARRSQKYEDEINELKCSYRASIDKCEASLKSERDISAKFRIEITNLQNTIVEINTKLTIYIKVSEDWQKKSKCCDDDSITLKQTIETLRTNLADTNKHLSTCVANSNSLQSELTSIKSSWEQCSCDLSETKKKLADSETIIINLKIEIGTLDSSKKRCQTELSTLRCKINQYLAGAESAEEKAKEYVLQVLSILDSKNKSRSNFIGSNDITCNKA